MKRVLLFMILVVFCFNAYAQDEDTTGPTAQGNWLLELNTGFGGGAPLGNTGFGLSSFDDMTIWSIGAEAGYFVTDDFVIKAGLGYTDFDGIENIFSYKIGGKYYVIGTIPFEVSLTGASISDDEDFDESPDEDPLWLGIQGGYAIFLNDNISIEPGLRYNISLNEDFTDEGLFEFRVGFVLFL
jgi:hypothetical protein